MAKIQSMSACILLLALIAGPAILSTEGRQIKAMNKKEVITSSAKANILTEGDNNKEILPPTSYYVESAAADINDFRPTTPGNSPGVGHSHHTQQDVESKFVDSTGSSDHSVDDFRPTTPGNSPGVGHPHHHTVESKLVDITGATDHSVDDDFRPTTPGHSPDIGHALLNKNAEQKA